MKKLLLTTAAAAVLSASSAHSMDMENKFYVKGQVGWSKLNNIDFIDRDYKYKLKSKNNMFLGIGAGYYIMDNVRFELVFDHFVKPKLKSNKDTDGDYFKAESKINTLMLNGFVDILDAGMLKLFVGAGAGIAQIESKLTLVDTNDPKYNVLSKAKKKHHLAFAAHIGAAYNVADCVNIDLTYSYRDMGKTKKYVNIKEVTDIIQASHIKGHHLGLGIRYDI